MDTMNLYGYCMIAIKSWLFKRQTENSTEDNGNGLDLHSKIITVEDYCFNYPVPYSTNSSKLITKMWLQNFKIIYHNIILIWITV